MIKRFELLRKRLKPRVNLSLMGEKWTRLQKGFAGSKVVVNLEIFKKGKKKRELLGRAK